MLKTILGIASVAFSLHSHAQLDYAKQILDTLCAPRYHGRGYVDNGDIKAADFLVKEFQRIGVKEFPGHPYTQPYSFGVNTFPYPIEVVLGDDTLTPGADYLVTPISGSAQGEFELYEINEQTFNDVYKGEINFSEMDPSQTIFAFNFLGNSDKMLNQKIMQLSYEVTKYFPSIYVTNQKQMYSVGRNQTVYPRISIDSAAYHKVDKVQLKINSKFVPNYESKNVVGYIPGKKKKKYIVFSAHYDHLGRMGPDTYFPGANDNASGVSMLLSLAKKYMQEQPKYSIVFCLFSGEEAGLLGSKYFVEHPYFPLKKVKMVLNVDIMGGADDGITVVNGTKHEKLFNKMVEINDHEKLIPSVKKRGESANSDHHFFSESGVPAFFIYSRGSVKNYHDIYDTAENTPLTNFDQVQKLLEKFVDTF
ncbi:M20/M25/M40 family metallo-hydrolase [Paracrocinitomix mangrovi]|uniref:M28 family metallopeptidase n=1 Tax=Paracrocinitomix mangrovi TaxID=2862509 RepID=UPI001C8D2A75|nr:M20/M25/M40 family metallo-hydrolase [Paracrocinitomix mangrovi]UKN00737.1 M20/M25/M40 family metallo-hydrolase [Paracrocinitomix mangrovi]